VRGSELGRMALRLQVEQEVDVALAIAPDRLRAMVGDVREAEPGEQGCERVGIGPGKLHELETIEAERLSRVVIGRS
jgi:hypothetical protein